MKIFLPWILSLIAIAAQAETVQEQLFKGERALDPTPITEQQISYQVYGDPNKPALVLIHGLGGSQASWENVIPNLSRNYHVIVYDQRGHGNSPLESENYSSTTMAHDLKILLDSLNIKSAHLIGHSMGGRTAIRFASDYPERTVSVTVEDMHLRGRSKLLPDSLDLSRAIKPLYRPVFDSADDFYRTYQPQMRWAKYEDIYGFGETRPDGKFYLYFRPHVNMLYFAQGLQENLTQALIDTKAPLLFLAADQDAVLYDQGIEHIKLNKPEAKIVKIPGSTHSIHKTQGAAFLREVNSFIRKTRAARPTMACGRLF